MSWQCDHILKKIFSTVLNIPEIDITDDLAYNITPHWDSIGHMAIVSAIEDKFGVILNTDDIISMSSFRIVKDILKKHGMELN